MAGVLDAALAKVKWARKRLDELSDAISSSEFTKTQVNFEQTFDSLTNRIDVTVADTLETNPEWSLMAADAVQNLRTALNYVVWELAKWNLRQQGIEREPKKSTQFPIAIKEADFQAQFVHDLHPNHVAIIRFLQPFGPPHLARFTDKFLSEFSEPGASHPLAKLAHLSNTDKHRILQPAIAGAAKSIFGPYEAFDCIIRSKSITTNLSPTRGSPWVSFDVEVSGPNPRIQIPDKVVSEVMFRDAGLVQPTFDAMETAVLQLISFFEPVFQTVNPQTFVVVVR